MEKTVNRRRFAPQLLWAFQTSVLAQVPPDAVPPQVPPQEQAPAMTLAQPVPAAPFVNAPAFPRQANLPDAPTSAESQRRTHFPTVAIREFRSSVSEITPRGATDMFVVALVKTRKFRVLERSRLAEGAVAEKTLNQQGMTTGQAGQSQYVAATYMFEAAISESSVGDRKSGFNTGLAGAVAGSTSSSDLIAIDVRMADVESGVVVDAVTVRKELRTVENKVAGVTSALAGIFTRGKGTALAEALIPNDQTTSGRKDSVDRGLREAIEEAVADLAKRLSNP
jgi:curli biogenesis system outer membrane secretion channel CsgG